MTDDLQQHLSRARMAEVPVRVSVELGRTQRTLDEAVSLHDGEVVELDRAPGEQVDIYVDGMLFGHGVLQTVGGDWAVRLESRVEPGADTASADPDA